MCHTGQCTYCTLIHEKKQTELIFIVKTIFIFNIPTKVKSWLQKILCNMKVFILFWLCRGFTIAASRVNVETKWNCCGFQKNDQTCNMWRSWIMFKMSSRAAIQQVGRETWLMHGMKHLKDEHVVVSEKKENLREFSNWLLWQPLCTLLACLPHETRK